MVTARLRAINRSPSPDEIRRFALTLATGVPFTALLWFLIVRLGTDQWNWQVPVWIVAVGCPLALLLRVQPRLARPVYVAWHALVASIDLAVSAVLLTAVYYLVMTPMGLVMRLLGRQPLPRGFRAGETSFWRPAEHITDARRYFRQF